MNQLILASQSPRRVELLAKMGFTFKTIPSSYEEHLDESRTAEEVAQQLALGKAMNVASSHPEAYVIGSDTVVGLNGRQMEKPKDIADAREMLTALTGHESTVSTGVAVVCVTADLQLVRVATTKIYFKADTAEVTKLREAYLATGDWKDKAGGYGIQSGTSTLIDHIDGDYDTIVGLPTELLSEMLGTLGVRA